MLLKFKYESEWLEARRKDVTSTEVAALFGLSPHKSRLRLWHEKAGNVEPDFIETRLTKWGRRLQDAVGRGICEDYGWTPVDLTLFYSRDPRRKLGSSFDFGAIIPEYGKRTLEVKVTERYNEKLGWSEKSMPIDYEFQVFTQMHLLRQDDPEIIGGGLGVLGERSEDRFYPREYDAELGAILDEEAEGFWKSITDNKPPKPDYCVDSALIEKLRKPLLRGDTVILTGNNRAHELAETYQEKSVAMKEIGAQYKALKAELDPIRAELHDMMGRNEKAIIGPYTISAKVEVREEYVNQGSTRRRFDFNTKEKGNKK